MVRCASSTILGCNNVRNVLMLLGSTLLLAGRRGQLFSHPSTLPERPPEYDWQKVIVTKFPSRSAPEALRCSFWRWCLCLVSHLPIASLRGGVRTVLHVRQTKKSPGVERALSATRPVRISEKDVRIPSSSTTCSKQMISITCGVCGEIVIVLTP